MKLSTSILATAALLVSLVSSIPLESPVSVQGFWVRTTSKKSYEVDAAVRDFFDVNRSELQGVCQTNGGWEVAAQVLLESAFRREYTLSRKVYKSLREQAVYTDSSMKADFVLPSTEEWTGMIIELKCENINSNAGASMQERVQSDINKAKKLKDEYRSYDFLVLAMTYSTEAENALTNNLKMELIPDASLEILASNYDKSSQAGSDTSSNNGNADSDTEMKDVSETESNSGKSDKSQSSAGASSASNKRLKIVAYQKIVDPQAPDTTKTAPTRTSDRQKAKAQA